RRRRRRRRWRRRWRRWWWWWWRWWRLRHRDRRGAVLPFARRGDRRRAGCLPGDESRRVDGRDGRTAARPRDRAPSERVAARVPRGRGELHGLIHLDRRRRRRDIDRGDRWGRRGWRWWRRRDVERVARRGGERSRRRLERVAGPRLVDAQVAERRDPRGGGDGDRAVERTA